MTVAVRRSDDVTVLMLSGKILGGAESNVLRDELDRALSRGDKRLLLDLSEVPWMNSAGLGILLSAYSRLKDRGGTVRFCGVGPRVQGILRTTKLLTVLDVLDDEEAGIQSFRASTGPPPPGHRAPAPGDGR
ncbi:STAS domain-containing protein [bacterium]|nr:STAS domain-containing protein [bacterium]